MECLKRLPGIVGLVVTILAGMTALAEGRPVVSMDGAWSFRMDPDNVGEAQKWFGAETSFSDSIQVPGCWDAQGFGGETDKIRHQFLGKAWYKRQVDVPADWAGKRVYLRISAVHRYASVWVNGTFLGEHIGYLSPFEYDITELAAPGASALVAVRVDSVQRWDVDTMLGAFDIIDYMDTYWGGIYGHVSIEARNAAYLEDLFVEPRVNPAACRASATVKGEVPQGATFRLELLDQGGATVGKTESKDAVAAGQIAAVNFEYPDAKLWTPDTPELYVARLSLMQGEQAIDVQEARFGFRQIVFEGTRILLNGKAYFLRGYGDDSIYPETMTAPSDEAWYRKKIGLAKEFGFNHVRHHSHILPPEYFDVCDELGMLVSPELPIGYQPFYDKAKGPALELYKTEWAAAIRKLRNHPSIFDWCMGNEMYNSIPIAPELYRIAKELDPTRPVVDTDGIWPPGRNDEALKRPTLDLYFSQFDVFNTPLENPDMYTFPALPKPVISHESGNYVTFPRLDQIDLFKDNFKPFWLTAARDKVAAMGLLTEAPRWSENSERLYTLLHKLNVEAIRKNPDLSGYHWWLFQDYWTTSNGIVDTYLRVKPGVDKESILQFNNDVVLVEDGLKLTYRSGEELASAQFVSNFSAADLKIEGIGYLMKLGEDTLADVLESGPAEQGAAQGRLTKLSNFKFPLPEVDTPRRFTVQMRLMANGRTFTNEWFTWVYPAEPHSQAAAVPLYACGEYLPWLGKRGALAFPSQKPYPTKAVYVSNQLTPELVDAVLAGASLVLYKPLMFTTAAPVRYKTAWWSGSPDDNNAGTVVYEHPVTRDMAPEGWCDTSWYRLLEGSEGYLLDELPVRPNVILRGIEVVHVCRNKGLLFEASVGEGAVVVCGLNLDASDDGAACPEAEWLTSQLIEYAGSFPNPGAAMPESILRERAIEMPQFEGPFVEGYAETLSTELEKGQSFSYRKQIAEVLVVRQTEAGRALEWKTAAVPEPFSEEGITFVFAGGLGWISEPQTDGFMLSIDGKDAIGFDVGHGRVDWKDETGKVTLNFVPRKMTKEDCAGLFYLRVPREYLTPGRPCTLTVRSLGAGSRRWFALHPYADVLGHSAP
ncbi:MAG: hypothetical protein K1Y02_10325 [Candidatus Hydrogenedentes bacterium]|nr:hypothetical protein [Candidatus Hydrogenedentota bacterium]